MVLEVMTPAQHVDAWFTRFGPTGRLTVVTKENETLEIGLFEAGVNPLCFTVNGVSYMRAGPFQSFNPRESERANWHLDECAVFFRLIAEIYQVDVKKKPADKLEIIVDKLKVSRGAKTPPYP